VRRHRRLRQLVPDAELVYRRAAGETLRALAADYGVAHTTLGRYFARPEVARQLRQAGPRVRAGRRAARARGAAERRAEREVRRRANEQARLELERARAVAAARLRPAPRSPYAAWLDRRDAALPLLRADLRSRSDDLAAAAVEAGGGIEAVVETTRLQTRDNVLRLVEPAILVRAFANDEAARATAPPDRSRLRRLVPDAELVRRRAAGEPLRRLARDYGVAHTTLARWFARPEVAGQLRLLRRRSAHREPGRARSG
jgi:lambda repressor-like predicted transcriptional regulator